MPTMKKPRADKTGTHRVAYDKARAKMIKYAKANGAVCAICGKEIDTSLKYPNPFSLTIDHMIPINKGGHPSDTANLQYAHFRCNVTKGDKLKQQSVITGEKIGNRILPLSTDWSAFE